MEFWHLMWSIFVGGPWKISSAPYWWTSNGFKLSWLVKVFRCNFWMMFFNSKSPKRTSLWSNSRHICRFWMGKLTRKLREDLKKKYPDFSTTIKYKNKAGKTRFHGSKQLRSTQNLASQIGSNLPWLLYSIFATSPKAFSGTSMTNPFSSSTSLAYSGVIPESFLSRWPISSQRSWVKLHLLRSSPERMPPRSLKPFGSKMNLGGTHGKMRVWGRSQDTFLELRV